MANTTEYYRNLLAEHPELARVVRPRLTRYIPTVPTPKQNVFLLCQMQEAMFGGAAGGGKSEALLAAALQYADTPGYNALILRRTYGQLNQPRSILHRAHEWLSKTDARWVAKHNRFEFPSGANLVFGYCQYDRDVYQYDSAEYQFCVARGTPVLMGDGSYRNIENICAGDLVATLQGPKPVTFRSEGRRKNCYALTAAGVTTIVGEDHHILTADGWVAPQEQLSTLSRAAEVECAVSAETCSESQRLRGCLSDDSPRTSAPAQQCPAGTVREGTAVCATDGQSDCKESADTRQEFPQPALWSSPAVLFERALPLTVSGCASECRLHAQHRAQSALELGGCASDCHGVHGLCGEQFHPNAAGVLESIRPPDDAACSSQTHSRLGGQNSIPPHSRMDRYTYCHPYTMEKQVAREDVRLASVCMVPVGEREVFDLRVAEVSHYVSYGGIISQNCGIDELTQFTEFSYRFMFSRLRRLKNFRHVPIRMRSGTNPGGVGHNWVKNRFVKPVALDSQRVYIPALLEDNPHVDREAYELALLQLPNVQRIQRRYANWDVVEEGAAFRREWFVHYADGAPARARRVRFWDFAATQAGGDYTVGTKLAFENGKYFVEDVVRAQYGPGEVRKLVLATALRDGRDVAVRMEQEPGSAGKSIIHNYVNMLAGFDAKGIPATGAKQVRWRPFAGQCENGNVVICSGAWVEDWLDELCTVPESEHDDQADSVSGAFRCLSEEVQPYFGVDFLRSSRADDGPSFGKVR